MPQLKANTRHHTVAPTPQFIIVLLQTSVCPLGLKIQLFSHSVKNVHVLLGSSHAKMHFPPNRLSNLKMLRSFQTCVSPAQETFATLSPINISLNITRTVQQHVYLNLFIALVCCVLCTVL